MRKDMLRAFCAHNSNGTVLDDVASIENALKDPKNRVWIDIQDPKPEHYSFLEEKLGLHHLLLEDASNQRQRPKIEPYENYLYLVVRFVDFNNLRQSPQLNIVLGKNYLLTIRHNPLPFLDEVWQRAEKNPALVSRGADFALYSLLDVFVDSIFPVVTEFDLQLDTIEEKVFKDPAPNVISRLFTLKRKLFLTRRAVTPMRDVLTALSRHDTDLISKKNAVYFRDVYDHVVRITESLDNSREVMTAAMEGYVSSVSNNLNAIMKKLTAITAIIMVPSFIAGIYGMNFADITEYAFGGTKTAFMLMGFSVLTLGAYFRWRGWL